MLILTRGNATRDAAETRTRSRYAERQQRTDGENQRQRWRDAQRVREAVRDAAIKQERQV
jgi:hypothetical protein